LARIPYKRSFPQANRITLTDACRRNDPFGDDFEHDLRLAGVLKLQAGSIESFAH
jgi:hypothetical protein